MSNSSQTKKLGITFIFAAAAAILVASLLVNVFDHKQAAKKTFYSVVELNDETTDPAIWGKNFPLQYDSYRKTVDMTRTKYGGSEALPHAANDADPRQVRSQSKIEEDAQLKRMWNGYGFAKDFREERGHAFMLEDQTFTKRTTEIRQPGTCANCHASTYTTYKKLGDGDIMKGFDELNQLPYFEARKHLEHPVACIDCHDSQTMALRVTRPAFINAIKIVKENQGIKDYDVNRDASRLEMRTYVCGQCHVEYYFKGKKKTLTFPWDKGLRADDMLAYYNELGFKDWTHKESKAPMLKAQHPEFEMWSMGTHGRAGVSCSDCHMPYQRQGALKVSDHHVRSPLLNIQAACQNCHAVPEAELLSRAETIQDRFHFSRNLAFSALMDLIDDIVAAEKAGMPLEQLTVARKHHRAASFYIDFVEAENSAGFHADQEAMRILTLALDELRKGQRALKPGANAPSEPVEAPIAQPAH